MTTSFRAARLTGSGSGEVNQPGYPFADEFVQQLAFTGKALTRTQIRFISTAGQLAMANAGDDTNSSQFFVTTGDPRFLDYQHTIFGQLTSGQQTLAADHQGGLERDDAGQPDLIDSTSLAGGSPDGVLHIDTSEASAGEMATITVTATDPSDNSTVTRTFQVMVQANPTLQRPFISPAVPNQVVGVVRTTPTHSGPVGDIPGGCGERQPAGNGGDVRGSGGSERYGLCADSKRDGFGESDRGSDGDAEPRFHGGDQPGGGCGRAECQYERAGRFRHSEADGDGGEHGGDQPGAYRHERDIERSDQYAEPDSTDGADSEPGFFADLDLRGRDAASLGDDFAVQRPDRAVSVHG